MGQCACRGLAENQYSLGHGFRLLSSYRTNADETVWVISEADRSTTTLLLSVRCIAYLLFDFETETEVAHAPLDSLRGQI